MDEDLRGRFRRDFNQPSVRREPVPVQHHHRPAAPEHSQPLPAALEYTPKPDRPHRQRNSRKRLILGLLILVIVAGAASGAYLYKHNSSKKHYFPPTITKKDMNIAVYYPVTLPPGFQIDNDFKVLQSNILYYSVTPPSGKKISLTTQAIPNNFDFNKFKSKFVKPDEYATAIGDSLVGQVGGTVLGSIRTDQNSWVILNSASLDSMNEMETITRSLRQVSL
jgi:hypothetical protein